jgi:pyridoxine 4-dehydrogenase
MNTAAVAGTWKLGDLTVKRIRFGAMRLTGKVLFGDGGPSDRDRSITVLSDAVELGVNHFDTAAFYFSSSRCSADELVKGVPASQPKDLVVITKVWPQSGPLECVVVGATSEQLCGKVKENLRQLGRDQLDIVNLRTPPSRKTGSIVKHSGHLADLHGARLIRHLGVSNATPGTWPRPMRLSSPAP